MSPELITFFTAMTPYLELKLAVPLAMEMGLSIPTTFLFGVSGTIVPGAALLAVVGPLVKKLRSYSIKADAFFKKLFAKTRKDHTKRFNRYGAILLIAIVAIPLPGSGTITAALVAFLFGIDYWKAISLISLGAVTSAILLIAGYTSVFKILDIFIQ